MRRFVGGLLACSLLFYVASVTIHAATTTCDCSCKVIRSHVRWAYYSDDLYCCLYSPASAAPGIWVDGGDLTKNWYYTTAMSSFYDNCSGCSQLCWNPPRATVDTESNGVVDGQQGCEFVGMTEKMACHNPATGDPPQPMACDASTVEIADE